MEGKLGTLFVDIQSRDRLSGSLIGLGGRISRVGALLTRRLTIPIIAATGAAVVFGVKLAASLEQSKIAFTTMLGSAKKADDFIVRMKKFAAKTPFEFEGLQHSARMLLAYGFDAKKVLPTLRSIGDAVAGLGGGAVEIQRATRALGQMRAKGKVASQEMLQLTELGIPAWEILAKKMGITTDELMEKVQKRQIEASKGIELIVEGMAERFPDMMKKQSKTLIGVWSTFKDELSFIMMEIGDTIVKELSLKEAILNIAKWMKQNKDIIVDAIAGIVGGFRDFGLAVMPVVNAFAWMLKTNPRLVGTFIAMLAALGPAVWVFGKFVALAGIIHWIYAVAVPFASGALGVLGTSIAPVVAVLAAMAVVVAIVWANWSKFARVLAPVRKAFGELWATLKKLFYELYRVLKPMLLPVLKMVAGVIGIALLLALSTLAQVLVLIINVITGVIKIFMGLGKVIYGTGEILWGFITGNRKLMEKGAKDIARGASDIGDGFKTIIVDSAKSISEITKATIEGVGEMLGKGNAKAADAAEKGGKAVGDKHTKGKKEGLKKGETAIEDNIDKDGKAATKKAKKHGEEAGAAYNEGMEGGLLGQSAIAGGGDETKSEKADDEEIKAHLHRRKAYWKAFVKADFDGANKQMRLAKEHQRKADALRGEGDKKERTKKKIHRNKQKSNFTRFQDWMNSGLKRNLNKRSGVFLLSRRQRLALQKSFQIRERFAEKHHQTTLVSIFSFFKNQVSNLDDLFMGRRKTKRITANTGERVATRFHFGQLMFITAMALLGPMGLLPLYKRYGKQLRSWLKGLFARKRGDNRRHWTLTKILTRLGVTRVLNMMKRKLNNFSGWLSRIPRRFYSAIMRGGNWMYRAGKGLVKRMIKGVKNTFNQLTKAGKKAGKNTRKGAKKGGKGIKKDGKKIGKNLKKGFKKGSKGAKKDGEKAGKSIGKGFKQGAKKGQKKNGRKTAKEFIQGLRERLGISSPSTVAISMGEKVSTGFMQGVGWKDLKSNAADRMDKVMKAMQKKAVKFARWMKGWPKHVKNLLLLNAHYLGEAGVSLAKALIGAVKNRLGIKSPSKEFERIGRFMIMGLIKGMSQDDLMSILKGKFGGWEKFAVHIMNTLQANQGKGNAWLSEFMGTDANQLLAALQAKFGAVGGGGAMASRVKELVDSVIGDPYVWGGWQPGGFDCSGLISWILNDLGLMDGRVSTAGMPDYIQQGKSGSFEIYNWNGGRGGGHAFGKVLGEFFESSSGGVQWRGKDNPYPDRAQNWGIPVGWVEGGGAGGGDVWSQVHSAFSAVWPDPKQMSDLHSLLMNESGMDPNISNKEGSGAWGLFQLMPMHHGPGKHLPQGTDSNLQEQIAGGMSYIKERYGSPSAAWTHWQDPPTGPDEWGNWYEGGGLVSATLHSGERVLTEQQNRWFTALAKPLGALSNKGKMGKLPLEVKVVMPAGTIFKIKNLKEGIVEVVDEGIYKHVERTIATDEWVDKG